MAYNSQNLIRYTPPSWASTLCYIPQYYLKLAQRLTPIYQWDLPAAFPNRSISNFQIYIKRDDMTGSVLSGNKVRKLEFLLADALQKKCTSILTAGGIQSNHCRTTAVAARQLGLSSYLFLRCDEEMRSNLQLVGCTGNVFLNSMVASKVFLIERKAQFFPDILPKMQQLSTYLKSTTGDECYLIPIGGSNVIGLFGYIECFRELVEQGLYENFDDIVVTCGSGGSTCGLALSNYLTGSKVKMHAICICSDANYFYQHIDETLQQLKLSDQVKARDIVDIIDGYAGLGYGLSTEDEMKFAYDVSKSTGIILDPVYNTKAVKGMLHELEHNPERFQGRRILYIHTGGIFGAYDGRFNNMLEQERSSNVEIMNWTDYQTSIGDNKK
ncbi:Bifunctional D-cysteine desulfhydrase/1-aminocyclopropane-1-carboxylate deaminase, mitochondrial [Trichoplax sp. H2]|nr:Bifunctional D-cysteine desulfhydrase/1-aminocyclopropane-1-carboxylate deaminase, mitochondrial [Trichoplax sp. H2]|eukprot:RDD45412.1 Bifunctional D-cysteine desulfhydrase/1-aminocyclopropane-1-carboxylate deaminase, mitochondrial [Trichoplax sp. H2]